MKNTRNIATTLLVALGSTLVFASAHAQPSAAQPSDAATPPCANAPATGSTKGQGHGMHQRMGMEHGMKGQRSEMSKLMTSEERTEMRAKMHAAKTPEERQALRTSMRAEMQKRAQEKGITLPDGRDGDKHQHGKHAG
jgi:hypothetical protein